MRLGSPKLVESLARALTVETWNPPDPDRGRVEVAAHGEVLEVCFEARDLSAARAFLNAYLGLAAATADAVNVLTEEPEVQHHGSAPPAGAREQAG